MTDIINRHHAFWLGEGPCLILIPPEKQELYDVRDYPARFSDPQAMWEAEMRRAERVAAWPTDGIPTVRPNLGVVFVPSLAGQGFQLADDTMPWPGEPLSREALRAVRDVDVGAGSVMLKAEAFYARHRAAGRPDVAAYHPDTQGVFDIAHLLYGDAIFYDLADADEEAWIAELLELSLGLYSRATLQVKRCLGEPTTQMIHGHGTAQGVFFPETGVRVSEDTAVLLSPEMIERVLVPVIRRSVQPFGTAFAHFCGKHQALLGQLCGMEEICAVDLGNPEFYETREVMRVCAATGTVLYSRVAAEPGEAWEPYVRRLAGLVKETGARVILRPVIYPAERGACAEMRELWHELTA